MSPLVLYIYVKNTFLFFLLSVIHRKNKISFSFFGIYKMVPNILFLWYKFSTILFFIYCFWEVECANCFHLFFKQLNIRRHSVVDF